jgi:hypothetical protein
MPGDGEVVIGGEGGRQAQGLGRPHSEVQDAPGPLPLLGAAASWRWARRLRARLSSGRGA